MHGTLLQVRWSYDLLIPKTYSRHLAETWSKTYIAPNSKRRLLRPSGTTQIDTIEHLILLDLLGAVNPRIRSYFPDTGWLFDGLMSVERRLAESGAFVYLDQKDDWASFFTPRTGNEVTVGYIGDDHVPFLHKGVSVLHIITEPFPRVWHTLGVRVSITLSIAIVSLLFYG